MQFPIAERAVEGFLGKEKRVVQLFLFNGGSLLANDGKETVEMSAAQLFSFLKENLPKLNGYLEQPSPSEETLRWVEANRPMDYDQVSDLLEAHKGILLVASMAFQAGRCYQDQPINKVSPVLGENPYKE